MIVRPPDGVEPALVLEVEYDAHFIALLDEHLDDALDLLVHGKKLLYVDVVREVHDQVDGELEVAGEFNLDERAEFVGDFVRHRVIRFKLPEFNQDVERLQLAVSWLN